MITIDYLKNHPEHVMTCAQWSFKEWGHHKPNETLEDFIESRSAYMHDDKLPLTLITFDCTTPVGMCSLTHTRGILPELTPWLAALYVMPEYRKKGIGKLLETAICNKARAMGFKKIYLFSSDTTVLSWYAKLGWHIRGTEWMRDHAVTVMEKDLS